MTRIKPKVAENIEETRICDYPKCCKKGEFKAPKDRNLKSFYWFCLKHVQEYNKNWDYYAGYTPEQLERELQADSVGRRPTWKINDLYSGRLKDPFLFFGYTGKKVPTPQPHMTKEQLDAVIVLGMTPPISLQALKNRYKTLAKKHHPDKTGGDKKAEEIFKKISSAYQTLLKVFKS